MDDDVIACFQLHGVPAGREVEQGVINAFGKPNDLSEDMFKKVAAKRFVEEWRKTTVTAEGVRDFDFSG